MATAARREETDLEKNLCKDGARYTFIQALRLLRLLARTKYGRDLFDCVRVRPDLALRFQHTELTSIEKKEKDADQFLVTTTFQGLYGVGSPLPMFYTEELFHEQYNGRSASRDLIDIINHTLYAAYFFTWRKCTLFYSLFEDPDPSLWDRLMYFAGCGGAKLRETFSSPHRQVRYAGFSSRPVKTAEGLRAIIADTLSGPPVAVEQCIARMAPVPEDQRLQLNTTGNRLGKNAFVGKKILDRMGAFRIHIGPVTASAFNRYLPDSEAAAAVREQVRFYLDQPLAWDIELYCSTRKMTTVQLGVRKKALLGWNTWIFTGRITSEFVSARFRPR
jgi:type VI secretion system protein ImpH